MPSKGSPMVAFRCPPDVLAWIDGRVKASQTGRFDEPFNRSSFILQLVVEGRAKRERSRKSRKKRKPQRAGQ